MASTNKTAKRIAALQYGEDKERMAAALWLGEHGVAEAFVLLLSALQDSSWKLRRNAATALGDLGKSEAVEPLIAALADKTLSVKRAAIKALGKLQDGRAIQSLLRFQSNASLGADALNALVKIGAPALLYCCQELQSESPKDRKLKQDTARQMIMQAADILILETMSLEGWSGQQRWLILETVRKVQNSLSFLDIFRLRFGRLAISYINDIPDWCERITRDANLSALHAGSRQVLDYVMLGRASQRDYATESEELLRAASGTTRRDTGKTLLRASDKSEEILGKPSLLGRLRRWLRQEG